MFFADTALDREALHALYRQRFPLPAPEPAPYRPTTSDGIPIQVLTPVSELPIDRQQRCVKAFFVRVTPGAIRHVDVGTILDANDPLVKRFRGHFQEMHPQHHAA